MIALHTGEGEGHKTLSFGAAM